MIRPPQLAKPAWTRRGRVAGVSYDAHITRAADWAISDEVQIPLEEWSAVATLVGLLRTRQAGLFYAHDADASFE